MRAGALGARAGAAWPEGGQGWSYNRCDRDVAQPGSAPALGAGGREFKSRRPDSGHGMGCDRRRSPPFASRGAARRATATHRWPCSTALVAADVRMPSGSYSALVFIDSSRPRSSSTMAPSLPACSRKARARSWSWPAARRRGKLSFRPGGRISVAYLPLDHEAKRASSVRARSAA